MIAKQQWRLRMEIASLTGLWRGTDSHDRSFGNLIRKTNESRMSAILARSRILGVVLILSLGTVIAGCSGDRSDPGAKRSQQQSEVLQERIKTTQVDR